MMVSSERTSDSTNGAFWLTSATNTDAGVDVRVGEGSPCHDFGGALRVTDGRSREPRQRPPKAGPKARS